jgi:hypothetical protein
LAVVYDPGEWLIDFMGNRDRHLTPRGDAGDMREFPLRFVESTFRKLQRQIDNYYADKVAA